MTYRGHNPEPLIVAAVIEKKADTWNSETRKVAQADAIRSLEALVAEYGVEATVEALNRQGFKGDAYRYLLVPMHAEAAGRRMQSVPAALKIPH